MLDYIKNVKIAFNSKNHNYQPIFELGALPDLSNLEDEIRDLIDKESIFKHIFSYYDKYLLNAKDYMSGPIEIKQWKDQFVDIIFSLVTTACTLSIEGQQMFTLYIFCGLYYRSEGRRPFSTEELQKFCSTNFNIEEESVHSKLTRRNYSLNALKNEDYFNKDNVEAKDFIRSEKRYYSFNFVDINENLNDLNNLELCDIETVCTTWNLTSLRNIIFPKFIANSEARQTFNTRWFNNY